MRLELPSLGAVLDVALATVKRFPLTLAAAFLAATSAILNFEDIGPDALHGRLLAAATLGLPLLTALTLLAERFPRRLGARIAIRLVGVAALAGVYLAWPGWTDQLRFARYAQLTVAFHLSAAFLPFVGRDRPNAFWQYNRTLFVRALAAGASSATLWAGLSLALAAVQTLFSVDVPEQGYFRLWAVMAFVVATWFFLGGVPRDLEALEEQRDYPAALRVFAQYTLVPLVAVYLVILTLYLGKVVVTWDWPSGWIGWLVSGVAAAGIFALLLVYPIGDDPQQRWVGAFARRFWIALLPSIVMLWLALYQRVHQYGITERRYFLIALSLWLAAVAVYYGVTRSRSIRLIPASLCLVALLTITGPWGAYAVSEASQVGRLRAILTRDSLLVDGAVRRAQRELPVADRIQISAITRYLLEAHGPSAIAPWFADTLARRAVVAAGAAVKRDPGAVDRWAEAVVARFGVAYADRSLAPSGERTTWYAAGQQPAIPLRGYEYLLAIRSARGDSAAPAAPESGLVAVWRPLPPAVAVLRDGDTLLVVPIDSVVARVRAEAVRRGANVLGPGRPETSPFGDLPPALFQAEGENARARAAVYLGNVSVRDSAGQTRVESVGGRVLAVLKR